MVKNVFTRYWLPLAAKVKMLACTPSAEGEHTWLQFTCVNNVFSNQFGISRPLTTVIMLLGVHLCFFIFGWTYPLITWKTKPRVSCRLISVLNACCKHKVLTEGNKDELSNIFINIKLLSSVKWSRLPRNAPTPQLKKQLFIVSWTQYIVFQK